ncbi:MAG: hypothetical protein ACC707_07380 [Thiohalomonadales bacterium]
MLTAQQEPYDALDYISSTSVIEADTVERKITTGEAWLNLQQQIYQYSLQTQREKGGLLATLTSSLNNLMRQLYQVVEMSDFIQSVTPSKFSWNTVERTELLSDDIMSLEALTVFEGFPSELEDLPGESGLIICLDRPVIINQYSKSDSAISENCAITKLSRMQCTPLYNQEVLIFEPTGGEIYETQSLAEKSTVLRIRLSNASPQIRHSYYPITANSIGQSSFFARQVPR